MYLSLTVELDHGESELAVLGGLYQTPCAVVDLGNLDDGLIGAYRSFGFVWIREKRLDIIEHKNSPASSCHIMASSVVARVFARRMS